LLTASAGGFRMADIKEVIKKVREKSKKRNFVQTFDLIVNLRDIDLRKPENRMNEILELPHGKGKETNIVVFSDTLKDLDVPVMTSKDIEDIAKDKRASKKLAKNTDFFLAEPKLMPVVGRFLGRYLAPRGKMPKPLGSDVKKVIESYRKSIRIKVKNSPVVQCPVGSEKMKDDEIEENIKAVLEFLEHKLPKGRNNIKNVYLKLTMGKPERLEV